VWWDGAKVVDQAKAQTFVDADPALLQLGLLKDPPKPPQPVVLFVDEAIDGESYADVSLGIAEVVAVTPTSTAPSVTDTGGQGATSGLPTGAQPTSAAPSSSDAALTSGAATTAPSTSATPSTSKSGCSIGTTSARSGDVWAWLAVGAALVFTTRKRWSCRGN
jgi:MYXO-CTERM domain-containing protein